ncbi:DUF6011 domain-containing protein [Rhodococcus pyridinivorans]|uniref:DUF6011 domain-containing protein n=1 Tax=Rhodococcus pyridinivorans TaxID=103816 RepID=UPI003D7F3638
MHSNHSPSESSLSVPDPVSRIDAEARLYGARIATRCSVCGRWLVAPKSRAAHAGPKCQKGGAA